MRKYAYLLMIGCIFFASAISAGAGPGCEKHEKKIEAIALTLDELEDGKVIELGDGGELVMTQDGDAWTFTMKNAEGSENSVFTIALDGGDESAKMVKIVTTSDGDDVWTDVTTGEEHDLDGKHCAIFIGDDGHHDKKVICKQFESIHCGPAYTCGTCGLTVSVPEGKDKGAYSCPNGCGELKKCDRSKEAKKCYAYKVVTDSGEEKEVEVEVEVE